MALKWDSTAERRFQDKLTHELNRFYPRLFMVMIPFFSAFAVIDSLDHSGELFIRLLCVRGVAILILILTYIRAKRPMPPRWVPAAFILIPASTMTAISVMTEGYRSPYLFGTSLLVFCISVLFPWGARRVACWTLVVSLGYLLSVTIAAHFKIEDSLMYSNNVAFLMGTTFIAIWGAWLSDRLRRESYLQFLEAESQQAINARVTQALSARDEFISIASHELKTPITVLEMQSWLFKESIAHSDLGEHRVTVQTYLDKNERQLKRLLRLVDDMLDLSKISLGKMRFEKTEFDLAVLVRETIESHAAQFALAGMEIKLHLDSDILGIWDRLRIEQVISNLFSNAIKYAPKKPLEILARKSKGQAIIEVRDHGSGVPKKFHESIFERFDRGGSDVSFAGLGLGLYISKQIVLGHGGMIFVDPAYQDGAAFVVTLPIRVDEKK